MITTWKELITAFETQEGWEVTIADDGITVNTFENGPGKPFFPMNEQGLEKAQQFWYSHHNSPNHLTWPSMDLLRTLIQVELTQEQGAGRVNSLEAFHASVQRRERIDGYRQRLKGTLHKLEAASNDLPALPAWEHIRWAQTVLAMPNLAFMEIDTTGLDQLDEMIRFTLIDAQGELIEDCLIKPTTRKLSVQASAANGIKPEQLETALPLEHAWERIQQVLRGRYVISFGLEWDMKQLEQAATRHHLTPVLLIGECLQRHATRYYNGEYSLTLGKLCGRVGSPLPTNPNQTSLDRARGQRAVLQAFAQAITDVHQPMMSGIKVVGTSHHAEEPASDGDDFDPFRDSDELP